MFSFSQSVKINRRKVAQALTVSQALSQSVTRFQAKIVNLLFLSVFICLLFPFYSHSDQHKLQEHKLLVLGDSLSAAYGLTQQQGWVHLLQSEWEQENKPITVINAAISGDTTDGGLSRLPRLFDLHQPTHLLIELGGNDALQGHNPQKIRANFEKMVHLAKRNNVEVLLQEIQIPTNYGRRYAQMFKQVFIDVSKDYDVPLLPFFLEEIALNKKLMQSDGIHPTAEAQPMITKLIKPQLESYILN